MSQLAQQELLAPPKRRRLIVPRGDTAWFGVDGSTKRIALAATWERVDGTVCTDVRTESFGSPAGAPRLSMIYAVSRDLAAEMAREHRPGVVLVEQPSGSAQVVNHELEYAVGVIQAAVYDGVFSVLGHGARFETVVASSWKKVACGSGAIKKTKRVPGRPKPVPLDLEEYPVMKWARLNGYRGSSWDEADALGIAEAARREIHLDER